MFLMVVIIIFAKALVCGAILRAALLLIDNQYGPMRVPNLGVCVLFMLLVLVFHAAYSAAFTFTKER